MSAQPAYMWDQYGATEFYRNKTDCENHQNMCAFFGANEADYCSVTTHRPHAVGWSACVKEFYPDCGEDSYYSTNWFAPNYYSDVFMTPVPGPCPG